MIFCVTRGGFRWRVIHRHITTNKETLPAFIIVLVEVVQNAGSNKELSRLHALRLVVEKAPKPGKNRLLRPCIETESGEYFLHERNVLLNVKAGVLHGGVVTRTIV